jgi:hypothetical protein
MPVCANNKRIPKKAESVRVFFINSVGLNILIDAADQ